MSSEQVIENLLGQLQSNLMAAGIKPLADDIQELFEKGFLKNAVAFEELSNMTAEDQVPDYLKEWNTSHLSSSNIRPVQPGSSKSFQTSPENQISRGGPVKRNVSITEIAGKVRAKEISPVELTRQSLKKISERNPILNAFHLILEEEALAAARKAEEEIMAGKYRGPLHGLPVAVKDLLAMAGTPTTAGSKILANWVPNFNSAGVERLEAAGAIIVGKTNMSEFAYAPGSINAHYGPTRNPHNLEYDTGGSSSGSGSAVADGLVFGALGSDTGGSIRIPASLCGLVGLKPTFGRTSLFGAITLSWSLDHLGPMVNTVEDAAIMLEILAGYDPRDLRTRPNSDFKSPDFSPDSLKPNNGKRLRIGVLRGDGSGTPLGTEETLKAWRQGLGVLENAGIELIELDLPEMQGARVVNGAMIGMEAAAYHTPMLRERLEDFGPYMRQRVLSAFAYGPGPVAFIRAQQARVEIRRSFEKIWEKVDLLSTPSMPGGAPLLGIPASTVFAGPFNLLGWPAITVPVGLTANEGLPLGLQLVGKPWDEALVLQAARLLELNQ